MPSEHARLSPSAAERWITDRRVARTFFALFVLLIVALLFGLGWTTS